MGTNHWPKVVFKMFRVFLKLQKKHEFWRKGIFNNGAEALEN